MPFPQTITFLKCFIVIPDEWKLMALISFPSSLSRSHVSLHVSIQTTECLFYPNIIQTSFFIDFSPPTSKYLFLSSHVHPPIPSAFHPSTQGMHSVVFFSTDVITNNYLLPVVFKITYNFTLVCLEQKLLT